MLPIFQFIPEVILYLNEQNNLVLQAEPGAGKSTALPLALLEQLDLSGKKILLLEPRRVAVKAIAFFLAKQLGEELGNRVGYQIKNDRKVSSATVLEIVTEGILTRRLQQDPELDGVGLIIFDEFHERSIHSDLSLMLCLEVQQTLRDDLKLLVMSATIDTGSLSAYMDNAPVIECPGRVHPVSVSYRPPGNPNDFLDKQVLAAIGATLQEDKQGDILVFLPGQGEIRRCITSAQERYTHNEDIVFLPLYGGLALQQQEQALIRDKQGRRKIIFATNIAETSLTIEGICHVIDSGLERQMSYDPGSGMSRLETKYISKASADQRKGRAGRTQAGNCIRLWSESKQNALSDFQKEEICISDLSSLVLELCVWGSPDYQTTSWLTPPPEAHFHAAKQLLIDLGLIEDSGRVSQDGQLAAKLPLSPRLAKMLICSESKGEQQLACDLAVLISEPEILPQIKDCDISKRLLALEEFRRSKGKTSPRVDRAIASALSLRKLLLRAKPVPDLKTPPSPAKILLSAYPDRLAKQRTKGEGRYLMSNGKGAFLFDDDPLFDQTWLVICDCDAQKKEGRIFSALAIEQDDITDLMSDHIVEEDSFEINAKTQDITGSRRKCIGAITINRQAITDIPSDAFTRCLKTLINKQGLCVLNWTEGCEEWLARASWLGQQLEDFPSLSKRSLIEDIDTWLLPYLSAVSSMKTLKGIDIFELLKSCISWDDQQRLEAEAPTHYLTPSNKRISIRYNSDQGPTVSVILQEMFGELSSPMLAAGKVPLRFELLSPAKRPIQTTSDLASFWNSSYFEVAKEMKGRYPKHRWPDKPLEEKAGRSMKNKHQ